MFRPFDFVLNDYVFAPIVVFLEGDSDDLVKVQAGVFYLTASIPYFLGVRSNLLFLLDIVSSPPCPNSVDVKYVLGLGV